jgi:purine-nucleoside phosphorylase
VIIRDHINMTGTNPLIGPRVEEWGERFPDMTEIYLRRYAEMLHAGANRLGLRAMDGVYAYSSGPCYETPAEYRYFRNIGADAVGMSTVPEVIVARHSSIPVFGMSVITDVAHATDDEDYVTDGEAIVEAANAAADRMTVIFKRLVEQL